MYSLKMMLRLFIHVLTRPKTLMMGYLALFSCCQVLICQPRANRQQIIDLCTLMNNFKLYDKKFVTVEGLFFSGRHSTGIYDETCSGPSGKMVGQKGASLELAECDELYDDELRLMGTKKPHFITDPKTQESVTSLVYRSRHNPKEKIQVVVTGIVYFVKRFKLEGNDSDGYIGNGFGHMGGFPALLLIQKIEEKGNSIGADTK